MTLLNMSEEYRQNAALIEVRIVQLRRQLGTTEQQELRRRLQRRIGVLYAMLGEGRRAAYDMAHYYEKGGAHESYFSVSRSC